MEIKRSTELIQQTKTLFQPWWTACICNWCPGFYDTLCFFNWISNLTQTDLMGVAHFFFTSLLSSFKLNYCWCTAEIKGISLLGGHVANDSLNPPPPLQKPPGTKKTYRANRHTYKFTRGGPHVRHAASLLGSHTQHVSTESGEQ